MEDPFVVEIAKKFLSWIDREKIGMVGKFFLELLVKAENGDFKSDNKEK